MAHPMSTTRLQLTERGVTEVTSRKRSMAIVLAASLLASLVVFGNIAQAGWGAPFIGGMIAGHVATSPLYARRCISVF